MCIYIYIYVDLVHGTSLIEFAYYRTFRGTPPIGYQFNKITELYKVKFTSI